jgi:predicted dehydrogenase
VDRRAQADRGEPQGHAAVLAQMAEAVRDGVPPLATGEDACAALAVIDAIGVSIAGGGRRVAPAGVGGGT